MRELAAVCEGRSLWKEGLETMEWRIRHLNLRNWGRMGNMKGKVFQSIEEQTEQQVRDYVLKHWDQNMEVMKGLEEKED